MDNLVIIIPFYNGQDYIGRLIDSIPRDIPVIIVDDHSDEPLHIEQHGYFKPRETVRILRPDNKGYFTGAVNSGIQLAQKLFDHPDVLILNQDSYFSNDDWRMRLSVWLDEFGMVGEKISGGHPAFPKSYIHGTFMAIRADVLDKVGLLNAELYPLWGSTCEYQLRVARAGYKVLPTVIHGFNHLRPKSANFGSSIKHLLAIHPELKSNLIRTPPEVSVIVSCYNYGRYLPDLIASLIGGNTSLGYMPGQTFQAFEVIIVDDGSQDNTREIAETLCDPYKAIHYIYQNNGGTASAHNTGIRNSYGRYITCISADDMMEPHRLATLYRESLAHPYSLVFDDMIEFRGGKRANLWPTGGPTDLDSLLQKNSFPVGSMYPRSVWESVGGYPEVMRYGREDWAFNIACAAKGYCGVRVSPPGYLYRRDGQNRTMRTNTLDWMRRFQGQIQSLFKNLYEGERPAMCCGSGRANKFNGNGASASFSGGGPGPDRATQGLRGAQGMVEIEYLGDDPTTKTWTGAITGARYPFSASKKMRYVDTRDLRTGKPRNPGFLELTGDNGKPLFREAIYELPGETKLSDYDAQVANPVVGPVRFKSDDDKVLVFDFTDDEGLAEGETSTSDDAESEVIAQPEIVEVLQPEVEELPANAMIYNKTVADIRELLSGPDGEDDRLVGEWLKEEKGVIKPRKTVIALLEKHLEREKA